MQGALGVSALGSHYRSRSSSLFACHPGSGHLPTCMLGVVGIALWAWCQLGRSLEWVPSDFQVRFQSPQKREQPCFLGLSFATLIRTLENLGDGAGSEVRSVGPLEVPSP